jgi:hypothetical protein
MEKYRIIEKGMKRKLPLSGEKVQEDSLGSKARKRFVS